MKRIFALIYDIVILALSYLLFGSISLSMNISEINGSVGIIGGAELPIVFFVSRKSPIMVFMVLFIIIGLTAAVSVTIASFKNSCGMPLYITATVLLIVTAILFVLIPPRAFTAKLYAITRNMFLIKTFYIPYYLITAAEILIICKKGFIKLKKITFYILSRASRALNYTIRI